MAKSKYEYVKQFEQDDVLLPGCWIVIRIDGKGFTKFSAAHGFVKPNDERALQLMDCCAEEVLRDFGDIVLAYGESDEYSFVFKKGTNLYDRNLRDYLAWRQVDAHINNQYNTCFWALVHSGKAPAEAQAILKGTQSNFKNELLFKSFDINYSRLPARFRKGSIIVRRPEVQEHSAQPRIRMVPTVLHEDIIADQFWIDNADLLQ